MTSLILVVAAAYLIGSIPFSYLVARLWRGIDVRTIGSGNVGATNVMRSAGRAAGLLAFALDFLKGSAAAALGLRLGGAPFGAAAATAAVIGHMFPVWLRFQGGKGVATGAGAFLPMAPAATGCALLAFGLVTAATRYVSLGSIVGALGLAVLAFVFGAPAPVVAAAALCASLIVWKHRGNIRRLARGTERRTGSRA